MATEPMDCTASLSKTGSKVVPPSLDRHTPPEAAPTRTVVLPSAAVWASSAETRPAMVAEPMLRIPRPEIDTFADVGTGATGAAAAVWARAARLTAARRVRDVMRLISPSPFPAPKAG